MNMAVQEGIIFCEGKGVGRGRCGEGKVWGGEGCGEGKGVGRGRVWGGEGVGRGRCGEGKDVGRGRVWRGEGEEKSEGRST